MKYNLKICYFQIYVTIKIPILMHVELYLLYNNIGIIILLFIILGETRYCPWDDGKHCFNSNHSFIALKDCNFMVNLLSNCEDKRRPIPKCNTETFKNKCLILVQNKIYIQGLIRGHGYCS